MDTLTDSEENAVQMFITITNYQDPPNTAITYLRQTNWDLERAIILYFESNPEANENLNSVSRRAASGDTIPGTSPPDLSNSPPLEISNDIGWGFSELTRRFSTFFQPNTHLPLSNGSSGSASRGFFSLTSKDKVIYATQFALFAPVFGIYKLSIILFYILAKTFPVLKRITTRYSQNRHSSRSEPRGIDPVDIARKFITDFNNYYALNNNAIDFYEGGYTSALYIANKDARFLLVYLHSDEHDETNEFVNDTLLNENLLKFLMEHNVLIWGGNVRESEAYQISNALGVTKYPFLALLCLKTSTTETPEGTSTSAPALSVITRVQGLISSDKLIDKLSGQIERLEPALIALRAERQEQELSRVIRLQQDQAYQASLQRDRQIELQRRQAAEFAQNKEKWLKWRYANLKPEVESNEKGEYARVAIRLPSGERISRRFDKNSPIEEIYAYIECHRRKLLGSTPDTSANKPEGFEYSYPFTLISPMPRVELSPNTIIKDEPVVWPNGNLIVEENES